VAITLTQLQSFLAVVRGGSVTAAAEELVVTQPSVSSAVAALSRELGVELTERVGRTVAPSAAGRAFAPYAADVLGLLEQGRRAAREAADLGERELRITAVTTAGEYLAPALIQGFGARHPKVTISLDVGNRTRVLRRLLDREADVALSGRPLGDERFVAVPFLDNEIVLITHPEDPLTSRRAARLEDLGDRVWLLREEGSGSRTMVEELLARHDITPRVLTLGSNGAIKHAVRANLGIALQSRVAVDLEVEAGVLATIDVAGLPARHWYALRLADGPVRPPVEAFMAFVEREDARLAVQGARLRTIGVPRPEAPEGSGGPSRAAAG
jgi:DNA-binding transcriptional LysR family regulator